MRAKVGDVIKIAKGTDNDIPGLGLRTGREGYVEEIHDASDAPEGLRDGHGCAVVRFRNGDAIILDWHYLESTGQHFSTDERFMKLRKRMGFNDDPAKPPSQWHHPDFQDDPSRKPRRDPEFTSRPEKQSWWSWLWS